LTTELKVRKERAQYFYTKLKEATELAKSSEDTEVICFDFLQNAFPTAANFKYILLSSDVVICDVDPLRENIPEHYVLLARK
jgi:hypothetical protein